MVGAALVVALSASAAAAVPDDNAARAAPPTPPNVIVIQTDDQTLDTMPAMAQTNALIGDAGATFTRNVTNFPLCCPSRATQLTGQYAHNHGVEANGPPRGGYQAFARRNNLATWLERAGYRVGHVGKFLNGYGASEDRPSTPYDDVHEVPPGWTDWRTTSNRARFGYYGYYVNEWSVSEGDRLGEVIRHGREEEDYRSDVTTGYALEMLSAYLEGDSPFYLQVDYLAPHVGGTGDGNPQPPYDCGRAPRPAPRHADSFNGAPLVPASDPSFNEAAIGDKRPSIRRLSRLNKAAVAKLTKRYECQLESLLAVDEGVAQIVDMLQEVEGALDNTYVFFMSDNGFFYGEHRLLTGKSLSFEPAIRVPLLARGPGIESGIEIDELTSNADFAATVLDLTGARAKRTVVDGQSLLPAIRHPERKTGREILIEGGDHVGILTDRYKLSRFPRQRGFRELYDLRSDPHELRNLANRRAYRKVLDRLSTRLNMLRNCAGRSCRRIPELRQPSKLDGRRGRCVDRRLVIAVKGADARGVELVKIAVRGVTANRDRRFPFVARIGRDELGSGRRVRVITTIDLIDGRQIVRRTKFKLC